MPEQLIRPHGGSLVDLVVNPDRAAELKEQSRNWLSWDLLPRQVCDLELLANGGFSPLRGFLAEEDYEAVCDRMRLADGTLWPMPINLDVSEEIAAQIGPGASLALRDPEGVMLGALEVSELYRPDLAHEAKRVFGSTDKAHPGVAYLLEKVNPVYVAGKLEIVTLPVHYDYKPLRLARLSCGPAFTSWDGKGSWLSRPATRCTAPTSS